MEINLNKKHIKRKEYKRRRRNKKMIREKAIAVHNKRNNTSSVSCDDYSFTYLSGNNDSNIIWR